MVQNRGSSKEVTSCFVPFALVLVLKKFPFNGRLFFYRPLSYIPEDSHAVMAHDGIGSNSFNR